MQLLPKSIIRLKKAGNDGGKHDEAPYTEGLYKQSTRARDQPEFPSSKTNRNRIGKRIKNYIVPIKTNIPKP
jgi:hypothetical protein